MGINNSLLKSIQTLVDKAINIAPFDKTRQAQIITNNGDGTYTIRLDGILYNNIPSYPIFNGLIVGTIVKVVIPSNQTSQMYVQPSKGGGGGEHRELTQAEYDALTQAEKTNGDVYLITDADPDVPAVNDSVPIGAIQAYGGQTTPYGWLICDGSAIRRDTYSELFDVIGVIYGEGDGSTTFNLPDLRGRVVIGVGESSATGHTAHALGQKGGEETQTLAISELPGRTVVRISTGFQYSGGLTGGSDVSSGTYADGCLDDSLEYGSNKNQSHNNMQPYIVTNYIIKAKEKTFVTATVPPVITDFIDVFYPVGSYYESSDASFNPNASWGGTWAEESETIVDDVAYSVVTTTIGLTRGSNVAITAPTKTGYTFVHWSHVSTVGWIGSCYVEYSENSSSRIWNSYSGGSTSGTGTVRVLAIYKKYKTITKWHRTA